MAILFDFKCDNCDTIFEEYVSLSDKTCSCPKCESTAQRMISPVRSKLEGVSGDFPGAAMKWTREHEKAGRTNV